MNCICGRKATVIEYLEHNFGNVKGAAHIDECISTTKIHWCSSCADERMNRLVKVHNRLKD